MTQFYTTKIKKFDDHVNYDMDADKRSGQVIEAIMIAIFFILVGFAGGCIYCYYIVKGVC